jgi:antibiotic biosynthesis monooxygenase (ABM) superfamily enzyme
MPPGEHDDTWIILLNFDSQEHLAAWQQSGARAEILAELAPFLIGGNLGEVMQPESPDAALPGTTVTQVIFSRVRPGMENSYREWAARIQQAQARYAGYRGMYLQPPARGGTHWITMLRFDSNEHLNAWMAAPERAAMLHEAKAFIESEELLRLATSFPGWVPIDPETGKGPPDWKTGLLVLLGLYPVVVLELLYLNPLLSGLVPAFSIFLGNVLSVAATTYLTMPVFVRMFGWWLFPDTKQDNSAATIGLAILTALFAGEISLFMLLFAWHSRS